MELRDTLALYLQEDFAVHVAGTLDEAALLLQSQPIELIVTDLFAVRFDSAAVAQLQQYFQASPTIPVVLMTGHGDAGSLDAPQHGLAAVLLKPFDLDQLVSVIHSALA